MPAAAVILILVGVAVAGWGTRTALSVRRGEDFTGLGQALCGAIGAVGIVLAGIGVVLLVAGG